MHMSVPFAINNPFPYNLCEAEINDKSAKVPLKHISLICVLVLNIKQYWYFYRFGHYFESNALRVH